MQVDLCPTVPTATSTYAVPPFLSTLGPTVPRVAWTVAYFWRLPVVWKISGTTEQAGEAGELLWSLNWSKLCIRSCLPSRTPFTKTCDELLEWIIFVVWKDMMLLDSFLQAWKNEVAVWCQHCFKTSFTSTELVFSVSGPCCWYWNTAAAAVMREAFCQELYKVAAWPTAWNEGVASSCWAKLASSWRASFISQSMSLTFRL